MKAFKFQLIFLILLTTNLQAKNFTIGVESLDYLPFYTNSKGQYQGAAHDILEAFAQSKGYQFTYKAMPINRLFISLTTSQIDMKFPDSPYWKKDLKQGVKVVYSDPVFKYIDGVMVKNGMKGKGKAQLKVLGIVLGFTPWDYLGDINSGKIQKKENPSFQGMFTLLNNGTYDGAYINVDVAQHFLKSKMPQLKDSFSFDPGLPHTQGEYKASSVKNPALIQEFNQWMKSNAATVQKIKAKYGLK